MNARASDSWWSLCVATGVGAAVGVAAASVWWKTRPPRVRRGEPRKPCDPSVCGHVANIVVDPYSPHPRSDYLSWEDYFMALAVLSAMRSKDPNRQVGAVIVSRDNVIQGIGYNGFPRGCSDQQFPWAKLANDGDALKTKYPYVVHAEVNAIMNKNSATVDGSKLYVTMFPCNECAKIIIQAGIKEVIVHETSKTSKLTQGQKRHIYEASNAMLKRAGVKVLQHKTTLDIKVSLV